MSKWLKKIFTRSTWTLITIFFAILMSIFIVANPLANSYEAAINGFLHTTNFEKVEGDKTNEDTEYFKSDFMLDGKYDDQKMRANSKEVALQAAIEGSVLLKNEENALPLAKNSNVSLFGISSANYAFLGDGSGGMSVTPEGNMRQAFQDCGLNLNMDLFFEYTSLANTYKRNNRTAVNEAPYLEIKDVVDSTIDSYGDAAVMIISRVAGEHYDITSTTRDDYVDPGNYLDLTQDEVDVLTNLIQLKNQGKVKKVILLINSANALQFKTIDSLDIDAIVNVGLGGTMSYYQIASILSNQGEYVISGRLSDTYVYDNDSIPSMQNFGDFTWNEYSDELPDLNNQGKETYASYNIKYVTYQEGVYVGYKYYETRYEDEVLGNGEATSSKGSTSGDGTWNYEEEVIYPFGYGLSYTTFSYDDYSFKELENGNYELSVKVTNEGEVASKDVIQIYVNKPYTEYDKTNHIEKPSVELVGFAKTEKLKPHTSEVVTIEVDKKDLTTYDSYNQKTYILEKGDYYLTIATDSHDAINNVIAVKQNQNNEGNTFKVTVEEDDFVTYSKSAYTENTITNQFDDADLNLYEGTKDDQSITYLSRDNWNDTYPSPVSLDCVNDIMVNDMQYGHEVEADPNDEMPVYNKVTSPQGELTLAMLMDVPYDDPLWEDLLNQMSVGEQQYLISYGLHHIAGAQSVSAPGVESKDGPAGIKENNPTLGTQMSFPSEVVLGQTFNVPLLEEVGRALGHEVLHCGYTGFYGPGACIHRSPYGGRNWEYFSEDVFLSGKLLASEVKGLQDKGVIVFTKHFALNDQESNRYGVATFANEQSIREIYLKPFEVAVTEGNMNGLMSSFNRIGCTWAGSHKGLLTNVLRDEWGFNGIVETDSCTGTTDSVHHMTNTYAKAEGLIAGNDLWMDGSGTDHYLEDHLDNPTVMQALRQACHRILYAQLHSNAMNGTSTADKYIRVDTWWQVTLDIVEYSSIAVFSVCLLITIAAFIINSKSVMARIIAYENGEYKKSPDNLPNNGDGSDSSDNNDPNNKKPKPKLLLPMAGTILCLVALVALSIAFPLATQQSSTSSSGSSGSSETPPTSEVHTCSQVCPTCGGCLDLECTEPACEVKCGENKQSYEFEAEDAELKDGQLSPQIATHDGVTYVGELNDNLGAGVIFTVDAKEATVATLVVRINRRVAQTIYTENVYVTVNGKEVLSPAIVKSNGQTAETWYSFSDVVLGCINLQQGENTISLIQVATGNTSGYNIDKIKLLSDVELTYVAPEIKCNQICPICDKCMDLDCPRPDHQDKCHVDGDSYIFQAENAEFISGQNGLPKGGQHSDVYEPDEYVLVGNLSENLNAGLTFNINSRDDALVNLTAAVTSRPVEKIFKNSFDVTVNGELIDRESIIPESSIDSPTRQDNGNDWFTSQEVNLGCINLKKGWNEITFKVNNSSSSDLVNFDYIKLTSQVELSDQTFEDATLVSIEVATMPSRVEYFVGETFDPTGMVIRGIYSDGTTNTITDYTYSPNGELTLEDDVITISYQEFTTTVDILVKERPLNTYRYEAENATTQDGIKAVSSNTAGGYLGELNENLGAKFTFNITSNNLAEATLIISMSERSSDVNVSDFLKITINDVEYVTSAINTKSEWGTDLWYNFKEVNLGTISLASGENKITFEVITKEDKLGSNIDYIKLITNSELTSLYPEHTCESICPICSKCMDEKCLDYDICKEKCGHDKDLTYRYEAENAVLDKAAGSKDPSIRDNFVENLNNNAGATITFNVESSIDQDATLLISSSMKNNNNPLITDIFQISVNGETISRTSRLHQSMTNTDTWHYFEEFNLGCISLKQGMNSIVLTMTKDSMNLDYIVLKTNSELTNNPGCTHKCPTCGLCVDPNCDATSCLDKCSEATQGTKYTFNAVEADLVNGSKSFKPNEPSGALGNVDQNKNGTITFRINASKAGRTNLSLSFNYRTPRKVITEGMSINVNGTNLESPAMRPASPINRDNWNKFVEIHLGCVDLKEGENVIVLTVLTDQAYGASNLMYLALQGDMNLSWMN